ncbi:hypothetical protein BJH93_00185 [Kocuria polaris]|nr:hypothetical protein [Kocuria polaris]
MTSDKTTAELGDTTEVRIGDALLHVPSAWLVVRDGADGDFAIRANVSTSGPVSSEFVQPNIVLRFTDADRGDAGSIRISRAVAVDGQREFPSTCLVGQQVTRLGSGPVVRRQTVVGVAERVPFLQDRVFIGLPTQVLQIIMTRDASPRPELDRLLESVVRSVREDRADPSLTPPEPVPLDRDLIDHALMKEIAAQGRDQPVYDAPFALSDPAMRFPELPPSTIWLSTNGLERLIELRSSGLSARFGARPASAVHDELTSLGLADGSNLTPRADEVFGPAHGTPDIEVTGQGFGITTSARVWIDGEAATLALGPTHEDLRHGRTGQAYLLRERSLAVPALLALWTGLRASWPTDEAELEGLPLEVLDRALSAAGLPAQDDGKGTSMAADLSTGNWTGWGLTTSEMPHLQWIATDARGPFQVSIAEPGAGEATLHGTDALALIYAIGERVGKVLATSAT